jgi:hypothetical protein
MPCPHEVTTTREVSDATLGKDEAPDSEEVSFHGDALGPGIFGGVWSVGRRGLGRRLWRNRGFGRSHPARIGASWRGDVSRVNREKIEMLRGPLGGEAIEGAFGVVLLIGDHAADAHDEVIETFGSGPEIADANTGIVEIGMKDRSEHAALRGAARIAERKIDLELMDIALENFSGGRDEKTFDVVGDAVSLRRHARGAGELDERPVGETADEGVVIEFEAANAGREHGFNYRER